MDLRDSVRLKIIWLSFVSQIFSCVAGFCCCWGVVECGNFASDRTRFFDRTWDTRFFLLRNSNCLLLLFSACNSASSSWFEYEKTLSFEWKMRHETFCTRGLENNSGLRFHCHSSDDELWKRKKMSHRRRKFIFNDSDSTPVGRERDVKCTWNDEEMNNQARGERGAGEEEI